MLQPASHRLATCRPPCKREVRRAPLRAFAIGWPLAPLPAAAQALDKVSFGTNWVAEAEHGGFYQALADGTYSDTGSTSPSCRAGRT